jgi:ribosomal protein S18 acetylase RimI-like enzyme
VLPTFLTASARLRSGEEITLRPLHSDDATRLGDYFRSLSAETRSRYGPHPFDQETADAICAGLATDDVLRITATVATGTETRIIGYFLLKRGVWEDDSKRYEQLGIPLNPETDCTLAPSVSDDYQNQGIGSILMSHVLQIAPRIGRRRVVLWGGVQATNVRAVHFYTKSGFRKVGEFFTDKPNFDMILDLEQGMVAQQAGGQEAKG